MRRNRLFFLIASGFMIVISTGIAGTVFLLNEHTQFLGEAVEKVRIAMFLFIGLAASLFFYTVRLLFLQSSKTKNKEKELEIANRLLVNAQHLAKVGNWQYNPNAGDLTWSDEVFNIWGIARGSIHLDLQFYLDTIHPQDREISETGFYDFLHRDREYDVEHRIILPDSSIKWVHSLAKKIDGPGNHILIEGTVQDITPQKKAEVELRYKESKYRSLVDSSMNGILLTVKDGRILAANNAACEMFQLTEAEMLQATRYDLIDETDLRLQTLMEERNRTGKAKGEIMFRRKDGSRFPGEISSVVFKDVCGEERTSMIMWDITERKQVEAANLFKAELLNTIQQAAVTTDVDGTVTFWNKAAETMYGWKAEEAMGRKIADLTFSNRIQEEAHSVTELKKTPAQESEYWVNRKDGSVFPVSTSNSPIYDSQNQLTGFIAISTDITERKKSEQQVIESEKKYRQIVDTAQEGIWILDENGITTFVNKKMCEMLEYSAEEILGRSSLSFTKDGNREAFMARVEMRKRGLSETHENIFYTKNRNELYTKISTNPFFDRSGNYIGSLAMVTDITDLKKAEEEKEFERRNKEALINITDDLIWSVSAAYKLIAGNKAFLKSTRESTGAELKQGDELLINEKLSANYLNSWKTLYDRALAGESFKEEIKIVTEYVDTDLWVEVSFNPIKKENIVEGVVCHSRNITERKLFEAELKRSEARYKTAQKQGRLGHWELNLADNQLIWSNEIYNIFGLNKTIDTLDYTAFLTYVHPDDKQMVQQEINRALICKTSYDIVHKIISKNGSLRYVHEVGELVNNEKGQPVKFAGMVQDITEQKILEEQLRLSESNYKLLFERNPVPLWMADLVTGHFLEVNEAAVLLYGYSIKEFFTMTIADIGLPEEESMLQAFHWDYKKAPFEETVKHKRKNGEIICVRLTVRHMIYNEKEVLLAAIRDVTDELNFQKDLKKREQQLTLVFDNNLNSMSLLKVEENDNYRFEAVNQALVNIVGVTKDQTVGRLISEVLDAKSIEVLITKTGEVVKTGVMHRYIAKSSIEDGGKTFEVSIIPIKDEHERVVQLLLVGNDLTDQKLAESKLIQSEEKYRLLFEKSPQPMWIYDTQNFTFLDVNQAAIEHYGYSYEEFLQMTLPDVRPADSNHELLDLENPNYRTVFFNSSYHKKKNGDFIKVQVSVSAIEYENKMARLALLIDQTEQEKSAEDLIQLNIQLRELAARLQDIREEERTNMAREIHDELGQQLTGLKMDIAWLNRKLTHEDEVIREKIKTSLQLIDGTINTVRKISSDLRPALLDDLGLSEAIDWHSREFSKRTAIKVDFSSDVPDNKFSPAVSITLFRIFQEALTNVARHAHATAIISSLQNTEDGLLLIVHDNGIGFDEHQQTGRKTLGLLGMKERVAMLHGDYKIDSGQETGTTLSVLIPLE